MISPGAIAKIAIIWRAPWNPYLLIDMFRKGRAVVETGVIRVKILRYQLP